MAPSENNLSTSLLELFSVDKVKEKPLCVVRRQQPGSAGSASMFGGMNL